jgi:hypothetical protein
VTQDVVVVHTSGAVTDYVVAYARRKVASSFSLAPRPVRFAKVDLVVHRDPARTRTAFAKAELDLDGRFTRAHAVGATAAEAIDALDARLRDRLERDVHRAAAQRLRHRADDEWRHGDEPTSPSPYVPRPVEEREIVRRKTFAFDALSPEDAALELEQLDHDFYLFTSATTGDDNVVFRAEEGGYELIEPPRDTPPTSGTAMRRSNLRPAVMTVDDAIELLDLGQEPFVFYLDATTGRGNVVYRRYDGNYGLITPADVH